MQAAAPEHLGTLAEAYANARRLLASDSGLAQEQAGEILKLAPNHGGAQLVMGLALAQQGRHEESAVALRKAAALDPTGPAWRSLGDQLTLLGDQEGADAAYAQSIRAAVNDPELMKAAAALCEGKLAIAEQILRRFLHNRPTDVAAIRMLAEVGARLGRFEDAERLLARCLELAPSFVSARHNYAIVLHRQSKAADALREIDVLLEAEPHNPGYRFLRATALTRIGDYDAAIAIYRQVLAERPNNHRGWLSLGHACKTAGHREESIAAYERSIACAPSFGEAYWSLANMKTHRFSADEVARMEAQIARSDVGDEDRFHLHYALGKAHEDKAEYEASFRHYSDGARIRRTGLSYSADEVSQHAREHESVFTEAFLAERAAWGAPHADPIFIVGLPRSGSTLVEQILASHSLVEGTMELPDLIMMAKRLGGGKVRGGRYPRMLAEIGADEVRALGEEYITRTRVQRKTDKPFFIDKMPNNAAHIGLIRLILPNAKIIDARRHPMAACFSAFKQHFARGQGFSYDLGDLGRYYRDYAALMDHFDRIAPGLVHRVLYERMVADTEGEVRKLLGYCGLPFEPACLQFYQNTRAVRTASSEQVRQPIFSTGVDHWRHFEPWLGALKEALGPVVQSYEAEI